MHLSLWTLPNKAAEPSLQTRHTAMEHDAWPILLQHPSITQQQQLICKLLCVGKSTRAAVTQQCSKQVPVSTTVHSSEQAQQFAAWLGHHSSIVRTICMDCAAAHDAAGAALLAALLAQHGHMLQQFTLRKPVHKQAAPSAAEPQQQAQLLHSMSIATADRAAILQHLSSSSHLTSLHIGLEVQPGTIPNWRQQCAALSSLTGMRRLHLVLPQRHGWWHCSDRIWPALASLTRLTRLSINRLHHMTGVQHLPAQLLELELPVNWVYHDHPWPWPNEWGQFGDRPLLLGHLTAVTSLQTTYPVPGFGYGGHVVVGGDVLPPNLVFLAVAEVYHDCQPQLQLQQLRVLEVQAAVQDSPDTVHALSSLTMLTELRLNCSGYRAPGALCTLPALHSLRIANDNVCCMSDLCSYELEELGKLTGLTCLKVEVVTFEDTAQQVAAVLARLTALQQLELGWVRFESPEPHLMQQAEDAAGGAAGGATEDAASNESDKEPAGMWEGTGGGMATGDESATAAAAAAAASESAGGGLAASDASGDEEDGAADAAGIVALMHAICCLPQLSRLQLMDMPVVARHPAAAVELQAAAQLTSLQFTVGDEGPVSPAVFDIVCGLTGLKELVLDEEFGVEVKDGVLPAIARQLQQLTRLSLKKTGVTDAGVVQLSGLQQLQVLEVEGTAVSEAARRQALRMETL